MLEPRPIVRVAAVLLAVATMVACGAPGGSNADPIAHPAGNELVLRTETTGGFVPPGALFSQVPAFSLVGDGRVVTSGPVDAMYPGHALPNLLVRRLNDSGIQAVLRRVLATRLFDASRELNGAAGFVADAPTTVFTLHAGGRQVAISVYALGMATGRVSDNEAAAHRALGDLSSWLESLDENLPPNSWADPASLPYEPSAVRLLIRNADADANDPSGIPNALVPWPVAASPETIGESSRIAGSRCTVATGADAEAWLSVLSRANQLTRFVANGHKYEVLARPLLPNEQQACPAATD